MASVARLPRCNYPQFAISDRPRNDYHRVGTSLCLKLQPDRGAAARWRPEIWRGGKQVDHFIGHFPERRIRGGNLLREERQHIVRAPEFGKRGCKFLFGCHCP